MCTNPTPPPPHTGRKRRGVRRFRDSHRRCSSKQLIHSIITKLWLCGARVSTAPSMEAIGFHDGSIHDLIDSRTVDFRHDYNSSLQMHSSLIRRLAQESELEGHESCVNSVSWNSEGSLLVSGSDDTRVNIWSYTSRKLLLSIETGHSANIFCTKFVPETSDELVVSGAGDAEVRLFHVSHLSEGGCGESKVAPSALFRCHTRRVKKLAVEAGNPNVVWSASEDGTLRQHDLREGSSCPPAGSSHQECRNVLLDLRSGLKKSLDDPPKQSFSLKSCDISLTRPHLLLVGGSDAFARLYDRRMLPPLTSCRMRMPPPPCVNYFCPMHLSDHGRSSLHLTHVTFSPNGEEVLLSYSGEHVYLMGVNNAVGSSMRYTSGDVSKLTSLTPALNRVKLNPSSLITVSDCLPVRSIISPKLQKCKKLIQIATELLKEDKDYFYGIEACNEVLDWHGYEIGPVLRHNCLCSRAGLFLKRKWKNDVHMAIRDCSVARELDASSFKPLYYMSEALFQLGKHKQALEFAVAAHKLSPSNSEVAEKVVNIQKQLAAAEAEKSMKTNDGAVNPEIRIGRILSLNEVLDANSDASQDGPMSEGEDSDYADEFELDFETSVSGDEGHSSESNNFQGLNLRIHRRSNSFRETGGNYSDGSPTSSQNDDAYQPEVVIDMKQRYVGHCNVGTDIKQASFLGQRGEYVASGSDDGRWFIWEKRTGRLIKMLLGDQAVVNCVQSHPIDCAVATSGIDSTIKIWTPRASVASIVAGGAAGPETANVLDAIESNQRKLYRTQSFLPFELLEQFQVHECAQS